MDLLSGYSDADDRDDTSAQVPVSVQAATTLPVAACPNTAPLLPAPVWDDEQDDTQQPVKRAHQQVTGAVVSPRGRPGGSKVARPGEPAAAAAGCAAHGAQHTASAPGVMTTAAATGLRLPPQLRGRPNVSTEDVDKLFTSPRLAAAKARAQPSPLHAAPAQQATHNCRKGCLRGKVVLVDEHWWMASSGVRSGRITASPPSS
ncbi:hypothetical protein HaLaN_03539 [Haematococcus lacustris]|uniref:Uncharacterized protein n=1 Tax=Haematococcus lacustris TaxID=44745 RepID=A0A699YQU5_HAELA|nr:hypothetical protein HaLaN_03539 [Haematococcus lacustris]